MENKNTATGESDGRSIKNCRFVQNCHANADTISYAEWIAMVTNVARCQSKLSITRPHYSNDEINEKIKQALNNMTPATCLYIKHSLNFNGCPSCGCGIKAPCGLELSKSLLTNI